MHKLITAAAVLTFILTVSAPAGARGGHGMHGGTESAGGFAGGKRHGNDDYTKAASQEEDRLLNSKLKSICQGC